MVSCPNNKRCVGLGTHFLIDFKQKIALFERERVTLYQVICLSRYIVVYREKNHHVKDAAIRKHTVIGSLPYILFKAV